MTSPSAFASILVGTDGSDTATAAVTHGIALARALGAALVLVSAYEPPAAGSAPGAAAAAPVPGQAQWPSGPRETALAILDHAAALAREAGVAQVTCDARQGDPADAIIDVAEEMAVDLIIVGNQGLRGARRFLLGSVPNKVSHHAPCSVLIVRAG